MTLPPGARAPLTDAAKAPAPRPGGEMLRLEHVVKRYGSFTAVSGVSLIVAKTTQPTAPLSISSRAISVRTRPDPSAMYTLAAGHRESPNRASIN